MSVILLVELPSAGRDEEKATGISSNIVSSATAEVGTANAKDAAVAVIAVLIKLMIYLISRCYYMYFSIAWHIGHTNYQVSANTLSRKLCLCQTPADFY